MAKILIVYSSRTGNTRRLAEKIADGARSVPGTHVTSRPASETRFSDLPEFDGIIAGSPVYFGSMAADIKALFDESVKIRGQLADKIGAAFATSGHPTGGKETTMLSILHAMLVHQMIIVGDPIESGGHYGVGVVSADVEREQDAALALGRRVADIAQRLCK